MRVPELTVVIGANGAGKTTWCREHRASLPKPFYNADSIAEGLGDANDAKLQREARQLVDQFIEHDLETGTSFGFESTYSGRSRPDIVRRAKRLGYTTNAIFLGTKDAEINIARVHKRVSEGGHHVAESEVRRRWRAAWANLIETWNELDTVRVLDSSGQTAVEIARKEGERVKSVPDLPEWAQRLAGKPGITPPSGQPSPVRQAAQAAAARMGTPRERAQRQTGAKSRDPGHSHNE